MATLPGSFAALYTPLMRLCHTYLILVCCASPLAAQFTPAVPGTSCDSMSATGGCVVWQVTPAALRWHADELAGRRIRFTGVIIARCSDQTLYLSEEAARRRWRESGIQLFNAVPAELNAIDSMSVVEIEGIFVGPYSRGLMRYAGAFEQVTVLGRHDRLSDSSRAGTSRAPTPGVVDTHRDPVEPKSSPSGP